MIAGGGRDVWFVRVLGTEEHDLVCFQQGAHNRLPGAAAGCSFRMKHARFLLTAATRRTAVFPPTLRL